MIEKCDRVDCCRNSECQQLKFIREESGRVVDVTRVKWFVRDRQKVLPTRASAPGRAACMHAYVDRELCLKPTGVEQCTDSASITHRVKITDVTLVV